MAAVENMRFSAVQEDGYGVGLGQETPPNDVDENIMAATGDDVELGGNNGVEEGSMISNLPLLFANGYPTSLDKITLVCAVLFSKNGYEFVQQTYEEKAKCDKDVMKILLCITAGAGAVCNFHGSVFFGT